jgi:hypothetical protein
MLAPTGHNLLGLQTAEAMPLLHNQGSSLRSLRGT